MSEDSLEKIREEVLVCHLCRLSKSRTIAVPGEGASRAKLLFVGEGPGRQEDLAGKPFVGAAGKLLSELLESINLSREKVFITNIVKCRPPENRDPLKDEIEACLPYLRRQVVLIKPSLICTLGNYALKYLIDENLAISQAHGKVFKKGKINFFAFYHPAAALYNQKLRNTLFSDIAKLKEVL